MSVVGIVSMKGGVGKTTLTANLSSALASRLGAGRVSTFDLDPQNALHWHFDIDATQTPGLCDWALAGGHEALPFVQGMTGVRCCSYGLVSEPQRLAFEQLLVEEPDWLARQIQKARLSDDALVMIDVPPGPSVYLRQVVQAADLLLVVVLPDGGSFLTVPAMEGFLEGYAQERPDLLSAYVVNQYSREQTLHVDVLKMLSEDLDDRLCPVTITQDDAVAESIVYQKPVVFHAPHSAATRDINELADWVIAVVNGQG